jgi:hypothetical protein
MRTYRIFNLEVKLSLTIVSFKSKEKSTNTIDNLFNLINQDEEDTYCQPDEDDDDNIIKEKTHAKNTQIIYKTDAVDPKINHFLKNQERGKDNFNVCKYIDVNNCIKEDYFNFENNTSSSFKEIIPPLVNTPKTQVSIKFSQPLDKNFRIHKQADKYRFSIKDIIYFKNKQLKMTNSIVFYLNHFYKKEQYFKFDNSIGSPSTVTLT